MKKHSLEVDSWRKKHPEKARAHSILNAAVRAKKITKTPCKCGKLKVEGHHEDYSKPLEVIWLCRKCHGLIHRKPTNYSKYYDRKNHLVLKNGKKRQQSSKFITRDLEVTQLRNNGLSYAEIAKALNISRSMMYKIYNNPPYT